MFNFCTGNNTFTSGLKKAGIKPVYKKDDPLDKAYYRPIVFYHFYLKLLNTGYMIKFMNILILYDQKFNVASEKVSVRSFQ